jgi:hypothetical protein
VFAFHVAMDDPATTDMQQAVAGPDVAGNEGEAGEAVLRNDRRECSCRRAGR